MMIAYITIITLLLIYIVYRLCQLLEPSPASVMRKQALAARLVKANESWALYGPELRKNMEWYASNGYLHMALRWGEEDYFIKGSDGAKWLKSQGIKLCDPGWGSFWTLQW